MSDPQLETWLTRFFAARDEDPSLTPATFLLRHEDAPAALAGALDTACDLASMLHGDAPGAPERIGEYTVVREIGRGGMGVVYEVERAGVRAALKVLPPWGAASEHARARFAREADALRRLDHRGIVHVRDAGGDDTAPWLVMELIEGGSLGRTPGALPPLRAAALVAELAEATAAAHAAGVVHRDIKPANVLLRTDGTPVLVDFGLAWLADEASLTGTGDVLGTPRYMAPEQAAGAPGDAASDVFALGLVLHELLSGKPARAAATREGALSEARRGHVEPLARLDPTLPLGVRSIVAKATARRPHRRYRTAQAMADDLRRFVAGRAVQGRPPGVVAHTFDTVFATRGRTALAAVALVAVATGVFGWAMRRQATHAAITRLSDLALAAWLTGADHTARATAKEGLLLGDDPMLRGLLAALAPTPLAPDDRWGAALASMRLRPKDAAEAWAQSDHPHAPALETMALFLADEPEPAASRAERLAVASPGLCARLALARRHAHRGERAEALDLLRPTTGDGDADEARRQLVLHMARARFALELGDLTVGLRAARAAARVAGTHGAAEPRGLTGLLVDLLEGAADRPAMRAVIATAVDAEPTDAELRFALAYSFDVDHEIAAAAAEYERVLTHAPDHAHALVCLAHLHSGADRETCPACAKAFAAYPELVDSGRAGAYALRALAAAGTTDPAVLEAGARVAMAAGATKELAAWLTAKKAEAGALAERFEWWVRRCERAGG